MCEQWYPPLHSDPKTSKERGIMYAFLISIIHFFSYLCNWCLRYLCWICLWKGSCRTHVRQQIPSFPETHWKTPGCVANVYVCMEVHGSMHIGCCLLPMNEALTEHKIFPRCEYECFPGAHKLSLFLPGNSTPGYCFVWKLDGSDPRLVPMRLKKMNCHQLAVWSDSATAFNYVILYITIQSIQLCNNILL